MTSNGASNLGLRPWQSDAQARWLANDCRGIIGAVTGGGKTILGLACVKARSPGTTIIAVPTTALRDQWWEEAASFFGLDLDDINLIDGNGRIQPGTINVGVLNTVSKALRGRSVTDLMLIVDECHKAATPLFSSILQTPTIASLGLSATPERPYDDGLQDILVPGLGEVIYQYTYKDALRDGVIVPFTLRNVLFDLEEDVQKQYDKTTKTIARLVSEHGSDAPETVAAYLKRARILNSSPRRSEIALRIVARNAGKKALVFHEDIASCEAIYHVLRLNNVPAALYHSRMRLKERAECLRDYRIGRSNVLVTCRALDEGFNVPETQLGIIAASTATRRQRIQRLGRALRPSEGKESALIYTLVASTPEVSRLKDEEAEFEGVANVEWVKA